MDFAFGFWVGFGIVCGVAPVVVAVLAWRWLTQPIEADEPAAEAEPEEVEFFEDRAPEWMRARSGRPYDPTAGYVPRNRLNNRRGNER